MHEDGIRLIDLMFHEDETICVHHNKYAYHSVERNHVFDDIVTMIPSDPRREWEKVKSDDLLLVALNPIQGIRNDANCYKFRNFLVEMDSGPLDQQIKHIKDSGLPYSAAIFSGKKSIHFLISLDTDIKEEKTWRYLAEWTLKIFPLADQNTKNPSRSIRIPGAYRPGEKQQTLYEYVGPTKLTDFVNWLKKHPEAKPPETPERRPVSDKENYAGIKEWVLEALRSGLDEKKGRNKQWFAIACEFALNGYSEYSTLEILADFFVPDRDFKEREWKTAVKSAFKYIYENKDRRNG